MLTLNHILSLLTLWKPILDNLVDTLHRTFLPNECIHIFLGVENCYLASRWTSNSAKSLDVITGREFLQLISWKQRTRLTRRRRNTERGWKSICLHQTRGWEVFKRTFSLLLKKISIFCIWTDIYVYLSPPHGLQISKTEDSRTFCVSDAASMPR